MYMYMYMYMYNMYMYMYNMYMYMYMYVTGEMRLARTCASLSLGHGTHYACTATVLLLSHARVHCHGTCSLPRMSVSP